MILISSIIQKFESAYFNKYQAAILPGHHKALQAMKICRTKYASSMLAKCCNEKCRHISAIPHSCGHRNCPHCQHHESQQWIENQLRKQLPTDYYLLTFTLPQQFRSLVWKNQKNMYSLFFHCVKDVLQTFCKNDKNLKGLPGMTMILHTHSRKLDYHPHIHVLMPGACIEKKTKQWNVKTGKYLFNHKALAKVFRAKMLNAITSNKLPLPDIYPEKWVVDCKNVGKGDKAIVYLGKYLYKGVIQEKDILKCENGMVTFRYVDSKTGRYCTRTVKGEFFLWLLTQHVLPRGFRRARSYGFLHPCSKILIKILQYLLAFIPANMFKKFTERPSFKCTVCGAEMKIMKTMIPAPSVYKPALVT